MFTGFYYLYFLLLFNTHVYHLNTLIILVYSCLVHIFIILVYPCLVHIFIIPIYPCLVLLFLFSPYIFGASTLKTNNGQ